MKKIVSRSLLCIIALLIIVGIVYWKYPTKKNTARDRFERALNTIDNPGLLAEKNLYSHFFEELIIRDFFQDRQGGVFVDVGCAWPIKANNTYYLEKHLGWSGIGIDALNDYAAEWKAKRPKSKFFSFIVTENSEGRGKFYKSEATGLSSTDQEMATGIAFLDYTLKTEEIQVQKISLTDLLDQLGIEKINLLSLDIEGHELEALKGIDLERFSPDLIVAEAYGIKDEVMEHLSSHGYHQIQRYAPFKEFALYCSRKKEQVTASDN